MAISQTFNILVLTTSISESCIQTFEDSSLCRGRDKSEVAGHVFTDISAGGQNINSEHLRRKFKVHCCAEGSYGACMHFI
jgi:hypothetical protein